MFYVPNVAAMLDFRSSPESALDFSLVIQRNNLALKNSDHKLETDVLGVGFQMIDIPPDLPLQVGLGGGYAFVDQQAVAGLNNASMGGFYLTLFARIQSSIGKSWVCEGNVSYEYLGVGKSSENQESRLHWNHFSVQADATYAPVYYLSIMVGAVYGQLDAKLTGSGDNNLNFSLETDNHFAALVGVNYHLTDSEKLAIIVQQGYKDSVILQFQRTFY